MCIRDSCHTYIRCLAAKSRYAIVESVFITKRDYIRSPDAVSYTHLDVYKRQALEKGDYETVGQKMYETHQGMSKLYEVSCEELDFLNDLAFDLSLIHIRCV